LDRRVGLLWAVILGLFFLFLVAAVLAVMGIAGAGGAGFTGKGGIGVVEVKGPITESDKAVRDLERFYKDDRIAAVIVRVDSPGGAVGPSQEIYTQVRKITEVKPVVVSMGDMAASGGYYLSASATRIVANPGTITGSIGVISQFANLTKVADKIGIEMNTVKSGPAKDAGNPFRPFSEEDRQGFQVLIDDIYRQFVEAVASGRELSEESVRAVADGRVLTGEQALQAGLVDELGNFYDAVDLAAALAGIEGDPNLVYAPKESDFPFLRGLSGAAAEVTRAAMLELRDQLQHEMGAPQFQYRLPGH